MEDAVMSAFQESKEGFCGVRMLSFLVHIFASRVVNHTVTAGKLLVNPFIGSKVVSHYLGISLHVRLYGPFQFLAGNAVHALVYAPSHLVRPEP